MNENLIIERLDALKSRIKELRKKNGSWKLFSRNRDVYAFNPVLSEPEIAAFERKYNVSLPLEYRLFLKYIGNGGFGPGEGVLPLEQFGSHYGKHGIGQEAGWKLLSGAFVSGSRLCGPENECLTEQELEESVKGTMCISSENGLYTLLILTGEEKGTIWSDDFSSDNGMTPLSSREKERFSFLDWYEDWLGSVS